MSILPAPYSWMVGGVVAMSLLGGTFFYGFEKGSAKYTTLVAKIKQEDADNLAKVKAENAAELQMEQTANDKLQATNSNLVAANNDMSQRLQHPATSPDFMPETTCPADKPTNPSTAQSGASPSVPAVEGPRVSADKLLVIDDLTIALDHNLQLQVIEQEFSK